MKINIIKDEKGKVVATFENPAADGPSVRPKLKHGHKVSEVEAAENYRADIKAFYSLHSR